MIAAVLKDVQDKNQAVLQLITQGAHSIGGPAFLVFRLPTLKGMHRGFFLQFFDIVKEFNTLLGRGSPARAGMVPSFSVSAPRKRWFPRTRGDGPITSITDTASGRVRPHARGWSADDASTAPRTRGDGPSSARGPPHARGWSPARLAAS